MHCSYGAQFSSICILERAQKVAAEFKTVYQASTEEERMYLDEFAEKWDFQYPTISKSWHANWPRIIPFFAYPEEIRKLSTQRMLLNR